MRIRPKSLMIYVSAGILMGLLIAWILGLFGIDFISR